MTDAITSAQLERCMKAILAHPKGPSEVTSSPAEAFHGIAAMTDKVYINFVSPDSLAVGDIYRTWIVTLNEDCPDSVQYFRSRKGASGDDTLPPDD